MGYTFSRVGNLLVVENTDADVSLIRSAQPSYTFVEAGNLGIRIGATWVVKTPLDRIDSIDGEPPADTLAEAAAQLDAILPGNYTIPYTQLGVPSSLVATPGDAEVDLDWTNDTDAEATQIQVATDDAYTADLLQYTVADPTVTKNITGLTNDTLYYWRIRNTATNYLRSEWVEGTPFTPTAP